MNELEKLGVEAIQFLLGLNNETELEETSLKNWREMSLLERQETLKVYIMCKNITQRSTS